MRKSDRPVLLYRRWLLRAGVAQGDDALLAAWDALVEFESEWETRDVLG